MKKQVLFAGYKFGFLGLSVVTLQLNIHYFSPEYVLEIYKALSLSLIFTTFIDFGSSRAAISRGALRRTFPIAGIKSVARNTLYLGGLSLIFATVYDIATGEIYALFATTIAVFTCAFIPEKLSAVKSGRVLWWSFVDSISSIVFTAASIISIFIGPFHFYICIAVCAGYLAYYYVCSGVKEIVSRRALGAFLAANRKSIQYGMESIISTAVWAAFLWMPSGVNGQVSQLLVHRVLNLTRVYASTSVNSMLSDPDSISVINIVKSGMIVTPLGLIALYALMKIGHVEGIWLEMAFAAPMIIGTVVFILSSWTLLFLGKKTERLVLTLAVACGEVVIVIGDFNYRQFGTVILVFGLLALIRCQMLLRRREQ
ncbi:MAG: hypothetical protein E5Y63_17480 [Mesorhizobium sp.]|uniref:hypothetical protein n=1 Tax=Mesorhizobium sp. TaxID=1871066 RepID=UPI0011F6600D|nr:hypothetical protein [Mesorhizobium sp.]TIM29017.1 MAG: hypothetical protein E5Y63_17480 [Mesorhizobium sp.]